MEITILQDFAWYNQANGFKTIFSFTSVLKYSSIINTEIRNQKIYYQTVLSVPVVDSENFEALKASL